MSSDYQELNSTLQFPRPSRQSAKTVPWWPRITTVGVATFSLVVILVVLAVMLGFSAAGDHIAFLAVYGLTNGAWFAFYLVRSTLDRRHASASRDARDAELRNYLDAEFQSLHHQLARSAGSLRDEHQQTRSRFAGIARDTEPGHLAKLIDAGVVRYMNATVDAEIDRDDEPADDRASPSGRQLSIVKQVNGHHQDR